MCWCFGHIWASPCGRPLPQIYHIMKKICLVACIIGLLSASFAVGAPGPSKYQQVIKTFIDSHMTGAYKGLRSVLDDNASYKIPRGEHVLVQSREQLIDQMKEMKGTAQKCDYNYEVLAESDAVVIARVDFLYGNGVQQNFLMLEKNDDKEWKIKQVYKVFKDTPENNSPAGNTTASN